MTDTTTLESIFSGRGEAMPQAETEPTVVETPVAEVETLEPEVEAPEAEPEHAGPEGGQTTVPVAALKKEREKVKRYTEEVLDLRKRIDDIPNQFQGMVQQAIAQALQQQQPQPQPQAQPQQAPDFWENPEAAVQHLVQQAIAPVVQTVTYATEQQSQREAVRAHGEETVKSAYQAMAERIQSDPVAQVEYQRIMASGDPWGNLVQWYSKQPDVLEKRIREQVLKEIQEQGHLPVPPQPAAAPAVMPSDMASARSAASRSGPAYGGPPTLRDIFKR